MHEHKGFLAYPIPESYQHLCTIDRAFYILILFSYNTGHQLLYTVLSFTPSINYDMRTCRQMTQAAINQAATKSQIYASDEFITRPISFWQVKI